MPKMPGRGERAKKNKVAKVMAEYKDGSLKSRSGKKVKSKDQAIAIALSEADMNKLRKKRKKK